MAAVHYLPSKSLEIDGALVSDLSLKLDWQLQHDADSGGGGGGSSSSLVAALPPQVDWQAISQAAVHCQDCDGFTGSLGAAAISLEASSKVGSGTVVFVLKNVQLAWPEAGTQRRRRLQQQQDGAAPAAAAAADCALQVGSQQLSFQGCQTVDLQPSIPYQVFYTLTPSASGGTKWQGGLRVDAAAVQGQWAG